MTFSGLKQGHKRAIRMLGLAAGLGVSAVLPVLAQGATMPQGLMAKGCVIKDKITECRYHMNSLTPLTKLTSVKDQTTVLKANALFDKDLGGRQAFIYLVNLPDMDRKQALQVRGALRETLLKTDPAWKTGMFTSDEGGLNVIGAVGGDRARMLGILEKWKSPPVSPSALEDFKSALRIAGATAEEHKGFQWITKGLSLSAADERALTTMAKSLNVRVGILHILETEADINRFAGMKNLAATMGAHYQTIRQDQGDAVFALKQGYVRNGITVTIETAALCGDKTLDITLDHSGTALKVSEKISYPACVVKEAPKEKPAEKTGDKQTDQKQSDQKNDPKTDQKTGDQKGDTTDQKKSDQQQQDQKDPVKAPVKDRTKDTVKDGGQKPQDPKQDDQSKDGDDKGDQTKKSDQKPDQKSDQKSDKKTDQKSDTGQDSKKDTTSKDDQKKNEDADSKNKIMVAIIVLVGLVLAIIVVMILRRKKAGQNGMPHDGQEAGLAAQYNEGSLTGSLTISGDGADREIPLSGQSVRIGRSEENDIVLTDSAVSGFHGLIRMEAGDVMTYTDLNSTNGTYVNNQQIESIVLHGGEQMRIGASLLVYNR